MKFEELIKAGLKVGDRVRILNSPHNPGEATVLAINPHLRPNNTSIEVKVTLGVYGPCWGTLDLEIIRDLRTSGIMKRKDVRAGECFKYLGSKPPFHEPIIDCSPEVGGDGSCPAGKPAKWLWASSRKHGCDAGRGSYDDLDVELIPRWDARPEVKLEFELKSIAKPTPSPWNGRCMRCGRGTYQGLFTLEHEGGGCP